jgi:hypothetical protein
MSHSNVTLIDPPTNCGIQERIMLTIIKWLFLAIFAALAWLLTGYTVEYFQPYKPARKN